MVYKLLYLIASAGAAKDIPFLTVTIILDLLNVFLTRININFYPIGLQIRITSSIYIKLNLKIKETRMKTSIDAKPKNRKKCENLRSRTLFSNCMNTEYSKRTYFHF